jgi:SAM-dependent methyltransferase
MSEQSYGVGLDNAWSGENRRLAGAQELLDPPTFRHLDTIGITAGMRCLEVGGGGGSVARHMAERVGPMGSLLVTDLDIRHLEGINDQNIEVRIHDICSDPLEAEFDIIHARFVLEHLPERHDVLDKLVSALRPGGWLLVEDLDWTAWLHLPSARQFAVPSRLARFYRRAVRATEALAKKSGADFFEFARNLPLHLVNVGLDSVDAESCTRLIHGGSVMSDFTTVSLRELGATLISTGHVSQRELDWAISALETPGSMTMFYPVVSAWGRRPQ